MTEIFKLSIDDNDNIIVDCKDNKTFVNLFARYIAKNISEGNFDPADWMVNTAALLCIADRNNQFYGRFLKNLDTIIEINKKALEDIEKVNENKHLS